MYEMSRNFDEANVFDKYFSSVGVADNLSCIPQCEATSPQYSLDIIVTTELYVMSAIDKLK